MILGGLLGFMGIVKCLRVWMLVAFVEPFRVCRRCRYVRYVAWQVTTSKCVELHGFTVTRVNNDLLQHHSQLSMQCCYLCCIV